MVDLELGIEFDRPAGVPEEAAAQDHDLIGLGGGPVGGGGPGEAGQPGGLGAVDPVELPGDLGGAIDQDPLVIVAGLEPGGPGVETGLEVGGVLAGQDDGPGPHPVLQCIESGAILALDGLWPRARPVGPTGLGAVRRVGGGAHGVFPGGI